MESIQSISTVIFSYEPLPSPDLHIRLVELEDTDTPDGVFRCNLRAWLSSEAPAYQAISYTWGDPHSTAGIIINGGEHQVSANCEYALRQARWHGASRYIWIDSICINQADLLERSQQVARMDRVFRNAFNVLACVGPHSNESELLMEFLGEHVDFLVKANHRQPRKSWFEPKASNPHMPFRNWRENRKAGSRNTERTKPTSRRITVIEGDGTETLAKSTKDGPLPATPTSGPPNPQTVERPTSQNTDSEYIRTQEVKTKLRRKHDIRYLWSAVRWILKIPAGKLDAILKPFLALITRPYFTRVWVMQEAFLAPKITLCCGPHHQPMTSLCGLSKVMWELFVVSFVTVLGLSVMVFGDHRNPAPEGFEGEIGESFSRMHLSMRRIAFVRKLVPSYLIQSGDRSFKVVKTTNAILATSAHRWDEKWLFSLYGAISLMKHLNCKDDRDRVYGVLGCVEWEGSTPIVPDYTKTTYELAVEVLQTQRYTARFERKSGAFDESKAQDQLRPSPTDLADVLAHALRISRANAGIVAAVQLRSMEQRRKSMAIDDHNTETITLSAEGGWAGYCIRQDGTLDVTGHPNHKFIGPTDHREHKSCILYAEPGQAENEFEAGRSEDLKTLRSTNGYVLGLLPAKTQDGDWVLYRSTHFLHLVEPGRLSRHIGLVIRASSGDEKWSVVGQALLDELWWCGVEVVAQNRFLVHFSAEDLLLLRAGGWMIKGWRELTAAEARERLGSKVCYPDGSSYAVRDPWFSEDSSENETSDAVISPNQL